MKPVFQTKKHNPPESYGNCYAACYASLLELPIEDVPPFEMLPGFNTHNEKLDAGVELAPADYVWWTVLQCWTKALGLFANQIKHDSGMVPLGYAIMSGESPRHPGVGHCVIVLDGKVVHDPIGPLDEVEPIKKPWDYITLLPRHSLRQKIIVIDDEKYLAYMETRERSES